MSKEGKLEYLTAREIRLKKKIENLQWALWTVITSNVVFWIFVTWLLELI